MGDGQGLTAEQLNSAPYVELKNVMEHYFSSANDLSQRYYAARENGQDNLEWILKLMKMKGGKDFVEEELRNRCFRS